VKPDDAAEWARRQVAKAPPLNDDQRTKLAELLRPVRKIAAGEAAGGDG
jgi:hypothetical protein